MNKKDSFERSLKLVNKNSEQKILRKISKKLLTDTKKCDRIISSNERKGVNPIVQKFENF